MNQEVSFRKVALRPIELLKRARAMVGEQYWLFVGIIFVGILIGSLLPFGILMGPMMCGIQLCFLQRSGGKRVAFELLFKGFDYFVDSLLAMLLIVAVVLAVLIPFYIVFFVAFFSIIAGAKGDPDPGPIFALFGFFYVGVMALAILISLPFLFVFPLIVDRGLKPMAAVTTSCRAVLANFVGVALMVLLYSLLNLIGTCLCYVPAILLLPLTMGGMFLAYREIFPQS